MTALLGTGKQNQTQGDAHMHRQDKLFIILMSDSPKELHFISLEYANGDNL